MDGEEEGGLRLSKRIAKGEVDYSTKSGTAWSHSYLNQKPWHPLSYPNQKRKWIAEQTNAQKERKAEEVAREFAQEQEFLRQSAAISKKEKEKVELLKAVSFMYMRPPGYNAESAKAAEIADETKKSGMSTDQHDSVPIASVPGGNCDMGAKKGVTAEKKSRPKDIFGRPLPTEEEFEVLKNAPRLETGVPMRVKPFGVEIRNVRCVRCGKYGHQSGDRECPLKDMIMPNEESRLKRDDPLTAIMAHAVSDEPLKWELKQLPGGLSPPRGGFKLDDPNQQIIPEVIFDEYGGFLSGGGGIPELLTSFSKKKSKESKSRNKKHKHKHRKLHRTTEKISADEQKYSSHIKTKHREWERKIKRKKRKTKERQYSNSSIASSSDSESESDEHHKRLKQRKRHNSVSSSSESDEHHKRLKLRKQHNSVSSSSESDEHHKRLNRRKQHMSVSSSSELDEHHKRLKRRKRHKSLSSCSESDEHHKRQKRIKRHKSVSSSSESDEHHKRQKRRKRHKSVSSSSESDERHKRQKR